VCSWRYATKGPGWGCACVSPLWICSRLLYVLKCLSHMWVAHIFLKRLVLPASQLQHLTHLLTAATPHQVVQVRDACVHGCDSNLEGRLGCSDSRARCCCGSSYNKRVCIAHDPCCYHVCQDYLSAATASQQCIRPCALRSACRSAKAAEGGKSSCWSSDTDMRAHDSTWESYQQISGRSPQFEEQEGRRPVPPTCSLLAISLAVSTATCKLCPKACRTLLIRGGLRLLHISTT
jgi:hypothetical protein